MEEVYYWVICAFLVFALFFTLGILALAGFRRNIDLIKSRLAGPGGGLQHIKFYKDGTYDFFFIKKRPSTVEYKAKGTDGKDMVESVTVDEIVHSDRGTNQRAIITIEGVLTSINLLKAFNPDESTKLINQALIDAYFRGLHDAELNFKSLVDKQNLLLIGLVIVGLICIAGTYYGYMNNEILVKAGKLLNESVLPVVEQVKTFLLQQGSGVISTKPA